jgi:hypothetical protein
MMDQPSSGDAYTQDSSGSLVSGRSPPVNFADLINGEERADGQVNMTYRIRKTQYSHEWAVKIDSGWFLTRNPEDGPYITFNWDRN